MISRPCPSRWRVAALGCVVLSTIGAPAAGATAPDVAPPPTSGLTMRALAAQCLQCHGNAGSDYTDSAMPALAGRPAEELKARLREMRDGSRPSTVMGQLARGFSLPQLDALAAYFAAQPATP